MMYLALSKEVSLIADMPPIVAVRLPDGELGATLRSLCDLIDISRQGQLQRIHRNPSLAEALQEALISTPGGPQQAEVLLNWAISIWATGLQSARLPEVKRAAVKALQREAFAAIKQAFIQPEGEAPASEAAAPEAATPQSVWQEGHAFLDHLQAEHEEVRREQRNLYNHLAVVQYDLHGQGRRLAALEASNASPSGGLSDQQLGYIYRRAHEVHQQHGYPIAEILAGLADHFRVKDMCYLPEKDWLGVLEWFASLLEE